MERKMDKKMDEIDVICPECWHEFTITEEESTEIIICPCCEYEFYEDESVTD
jgi:uncharacterized CHY-type Zn-finger protein